MHGLTRESVRENLELGEGYDEWLTDLDDLGPPGEPLVPPPAGHTAGLLDRLGFAPEDRAEALATRIRPREHPEMWWLLERSHHAVTRGLRPDSPRWSLPILPDRLGPIGRFFPLHVLLSAVGVLREWHRHRGVDDKISWATLRDLGRGVAIHRATYGCGGLDKASWLTHHFRGELFELGRLQFELQTLTAPPRTPMCWYDDAESARRGVGFRPGDAALGLHIPATGPLTPQACDDSLALARTFVARHFPDPMRRLVVCTSWLLDEQLADYLPAGSNMVRFQRRFTMVPGAPDDDHEPLRFVFRHVPPDLDQLARDTTLQRALADHLRDGGHWRVRTGWFAL